MEYPVKYTGYIFCQRQSSPHWWPPLIATRSAVREQRNK